MCAKKIGLASIGERGRVSRNDGRLGATERGVSGCRASSDVSGECGLKPGPVACHGVGKRVPIWRIVDDKASMRVYLP